MEENPGFAEFIEDFSVEGMLHSLTVRSHIARGILKEIKSPKLPDDYYFISAAHIPGKNQLTGLPVEILASEKLSYIGQPVAILAGPDESALEELLSQVELVTEETEANFFGGDCGEENVIVRRNISDGEYQSREGAVIISGTYTTGIQDHWHSEPHGVVAVPSYPSNGGSGKPADAIVTVYSSTQWPFHVKRSILDALGWDGDRVNVKTALMSMHLDGRIWYPSLVACHAALAAVMAKKPVKLMLASEEDFMFTPKRSQSKIKIKSELGEKAEIQNTAVEISVDLGAGSIFEDEIMDHTCLGTLGLYNRKSFSINGIGLYTNIPPQGTMAGFGLAQGFFAAERHVSRIAESAGQDPAEWRKNNFLPENQKLAAGKPLKDPAPLTELIDMVAVVSDYYRKWASYELLRKKRRTVKWASEMEALRGIGISVACQGNGFLYENSELGNGNCSVELTLDKEGFLEIKSSIVSSVAKHQEIWRNLAYEILGVVPSMSRFTGDTDSVPDSGPATLSRKITNVTKLVELCCMDIRNQRFRETLPITVKRSYVPDKIPGWVPGKDIDAEAFACPGSGAAVAEIEIDPVSLEPLIRGIWLIVDGGNILYPREAAYILRTGVIQALGWTCREQIHYDKGKIPPEYYRNYNIAPPEGMPSIYVDFYYNETVSPKGVGDLPFSCVPAAYVQAVSQAMDHHFEKIPLDQREIWEAWKLKQTEVPQ